jgi:hypothetical protein
MPAPLAPPVTLARDEQSRLEAIARAPSTPQALAFRCQVILRVAAPEHSSNLQVAQELHCNRHTCGLSHIMADSRQIIWREPLRSLCKYSLRA